MEIMEKRSSGENIPLSLREKKLSVKERRQNTECGWRADDGHLLACQSVPRVHRTPSHLFTRMSFINLGLEKVWMEVWDWRMSKEVEQVLEIGME